MRPEGSSTTAPRDPEQIPIGGIGLLSEAIKPRRSGPFCNWAEKPIDREEHIDWIDERCNEVMVQAEHQFACYLVHGRFNYGHEEFGFRVERCFEDKIGAKARLQKTKWLSDLAAENCDWLLRTVCPHFDPEKTKCDACSAIVDNSKCSVEHVASRLFDALKNQHVVVLIHDVQIVEMATIYHSVLEPLCSAIDRMPEKPANHLHVVLFYEWGDSDQVPAWPEKKEGSPSMRLIEVPELTRFTEDHLTRWFTRAGLGNAEAHEYAKSIMLRTRGDPAGVYKSCLERLAY